MTIKKISSKYTNKNNQSEFFTSLVKNMLLTRFTTQATQNVSIIFNKIRVNLKF